MEKEIRKAVVTALKKEFPGCAVYTEKMPQNGKRDGFWIHPTGMGDEGRIGCRWSWCRWMVKYFPPEELARETMAQRMGRMTMAMAQLKLEDGVVRPSRIEARCEPQWAEVAFTVGCRVREVPAQTPMKKMMWKQEVEV